jgi:anaphase-promoting complex subunit 8
MRDFFLASVDLDLQRNSDGLARYRALYALFPRSDHILAQTATAHYNLRDFDEAEGLFEELLRSDPYRIEGMDIYSNILYVKECFAALSHLAHKSVLTDKYRPETCCIIGNYYSLKAQHEKAVLYFKRALRLNRKYLSAWTLMGHEYVEMKNTPAAIDAYRRAVDINPRDYRAWYGLGQTYEILAMPYYALYYYRRATQLRPHDARMWCAMGQCYETEQLNMHDAAIRCYRRALSNSDREGIALHKLAKLHENLGQADQAAFYYRKNLERMEADQNEGQDFVDALLFLGNYCKNKGSLEEAEKFCDRLLDYGDPAKEDAKALLREIRSVQQHTANLPSMDLEQYTP